LTGLGIRRTLAGMNVHAASAALLVFAGGLLLGAAATAINSAENRGGQRNPVGWYLLGASVVGAATGTYMGSLP
jgi:hypothetical protein